MLVADDDEDAANSLGILLEIMGNEVLTVNDGLRAVEAAEAFRPDVILLDIGMPKLNGYEVCRRIRERPWGVKAVLIALTGWGQEEDERRSQEAGFDHHMVKPVDPRPFRNFWPGRRTQGSDGTIERSGVAWKECSLDLPGRFLSLRCLRPAPGGDVLPADAAVAPAVPRRPVTAAFHGDGPRTVLLLETGVGIAAMEAALSWLLSGPPVDGVRFHPAVILSAGFSGAIVPGLRVGDLVLADAVCDGDGGSWPATWPIGTGPHRRGRLLTAAALVGRPEEKRRSASGAGPSPWTWRRPRSPGWRRRPTCRSAACASFRTTWTRLCRRACSAYWLPAACGRGG